MFLSIAQARKANEKAVVVERRREARGGDAAAEPSTRKWYEDKKKQQEAELEQVGLSTSDAYLRETAETAAAKLEKKRKKPTTSGWYGRGKGGRGRGGGRRKRSVGATRVREATRPARGGKRERAADGGVFPGRSPERHGAVGASPG